MAFSSLDSELLGPLFTTEPMRAAFGDRARLRAMLRAEAALARAEAANGLVPETLADAIDAVSTDALDLAALGRGTALAGVPVIPFVKAVRRALPAGLEPSFHKGATTQDIADTALVLQMADGFRLIEAELGPILVGLGSLAERHRSTPCIGRTYTQHAAPISFGYKAATWALGIAEVAAQLPDLRGRMLTASLGGPVGTLASLGERAEAVARAYADELGLVPETVAWHTRRARIAETGAWLTRLLGALAKFATDVSHLASTEVGEVAEPHIPGRGGSSTMPHKRNPVCSTVILAAFTASKGHAATLLDGMAAAHERPAGLWHAEWHALPPLFGLASGALREARSLAEGLTIDEARMTANLGITRGLLFADAAAARLAPYLGAETAHAVVEEAASQVRSGVGSLEEALSVVLARKPEIADLDMAAAFDVAPAVMAAAGATDRALAALNALDSEQSSRKANVPCP